MIKQEHIDGRVQKAFNDKTKSLKKLNPTTDKNFFTGTALDVSSVNPMDQEFYRMPFAKVSIAVPDIKASDKNGIVRQPISISSYMNDQGDNEILGVADKENNKPLAFIQGYNESETNRFRGHTGIKSIKQTQQEYYTSQYTIDWECPDPVYFEQVFEPAFLKLGAAVTLEFGYGNALTDIKIPPITIEDMTRYLNDQELTNTITETVFKEDKEGFELAEENTRQDTIRDRNMRAPGTYFCDIGIIDNFDYKLTEGGGYTGTIRIISMGTSPLLETNKPGDESDNSNDLRRSLNSLTKFDKKSRELFGSSEGLDEEQKSEVFKNLIQSSSDIKTLLEAGVTFGAVIKNLDKVLDKYFDTNQAGFKINEGYSTHYIGEDEGKPFVKYRFKDGAMYFDFEVNTPIRTVVDFIDKYNLTIFVEKSGFYDALRGKKGGLYNGGYEENSKLRGRYFMSWGFFEDIILGSFFELKADMSAGSDGNYIQRIRSVDKKRQPNKCIKSDFLYSLGLDKVMLPGKTHPLLKNPLEGFTDEEKNLVRSIYKPKQLRSLETIKAIYEIFDEEYKNWAQGKSKFNHQTRKKEYVKATEGQIRDMVFPVELYKKHFENASSLRQSLTNFWADVSGMYGGYWRFVVGQSQDDSVSIGISDMRLSPKDPVTPTQKSDLESKQDKELAKLENCYVFELYSEDSIVKSFDLSLDLSSEMAVLARQGKYKPEGTTSDIKSLSDVSIEAWNLLTESKTLSKIEKEAGNLEEYNKLKKLQPELIKNLSYPSDNGKSRAYVKDNYKSSTNIRERNESGFDFFTIPEINEDTTQELEKINNDYTSLYKGIGIYDKNGNMSSYFKQTMLYLLNTAKIKGSGSLITTNPILIPVSITMTLDGIGGLKVGDIFKVDYLPKQYRKHTYFVIQKVEHSITSAGWTTEVGAYMQMIPQSYFKEHKFKLLTVEAEDLQKLFEFNDIDFNDVIVGLGDTGQSTLQEKLEGIAEKIEEMNVQKELLNQKEKLRKLATQSGNGSLRTTQRYYLKELGQMERDLEQQRTEVNQLIQNIEPFKPTLDTVNTNVDNAIIAAREFAFEYKLEEESSSKSYSYRSQI